MAKARVVIATPSVIDQKRLEKALAATSDFELAAVASNLSQTYLLVEALMPDYVIIAEGFARQDEYLCMENLFRAVQTRVVSIAGAVLRQEAPSAIVKNMGNGVGVKPSAITVAAGIDANAISSALRLAPAPEPFAPPRLVAHSPQPEKVSHLATHRSKAMPDTRDWVILIGASTGGIDALTTILPHFPALCPPIAIVQHTGQSFAQTLARLLDRYCAANVVMAQTGLEMSTGRVCLAGGIDGHLQLIKKQNLVCNVVGGPATSGHIPSIDELFFSALPFARQVIAVLLTGMGRDGAEGLLALRKAGAITIGQDEQSSVVYGMPRVAHELGAVQHQLPLTDIGPAIMQFMSNGVDQHKRAAQ